MTLLFEHDCEGSTDEANVAVGVSTFGDAWNNVVKSTTLASPAVSTMVIKYDSDVTKVKNGTRTIRFTRGASTDSGYCQATLATAVPRLQTRGYYLFGEVPSAQTNIIIHRGSGFMGYIGVNASAKLQAYNATNASVSGSAHATKTIAALTQYRIESAIKAGATGTSDGTLEFAYYLGDSATAEHTFSSSLVSTGTADPITGRCGIASTGAGVTNNLWVDDFALGDGATGFLGPSSTTVTPPTAIVNNRVGNLVDLTDSTAPSGQTITSYALTPMGGAPAPELIVAGVWFVVPSTTATYTYTGTVTTNLGATKDITVTINPLSTATVPTQLFKKVAGVFT